MLGAWMAGVSQQLRVSFEALVILLLVSLVSRASKSIFSITALNLEQIKSVPTSIQFLKLHLSPWVSRAAPSMRG